MTEQNEIFEQLTELENTLSASLAQVSHMRQVLDSSMRENATLRMELEKVRERLAEFEKEEIKKDKKEASKKQANPNLIQIYEEGFHVCHLHYAERLAEGESCLDCLELLYRE